MMVVVMVMVVMMMMMMPVGPVVRGIAIPVGIVRVVVRIARLTVWVIVILHRLPLRRFLCQQLARVRHGGEQVGVRTGVQRLVDRLRLRGGCVRRTERRQSGDGAYQSDGLLVHAGSPSADPDGTRVPRPIYGGVGHPRAVLLDAA